MVGPGCHPCSGIHACPGGLHQGLVSMDVKLAEKPRGIESILMTLRSLPFQDDIPGPGFYDVIHQSPVFDSVSLSKKGTGTFPSMVRTPSRSEGIICGMLSFLRCTSRYWPSGPFSPKACGSI